MKKSLKSILLVALVAAMLPSCSKKEAEGSETAAEQAKEEVPIVEVQNASMQMIDQSAEYSATVEAFKTNNISSNSGCRIKRMLVDVGSHVSAGQQLVVLDDVNIAQTEISMADINRNLQRAKELVRIGGGTQQTVDQLQAQYDANARSLRTMRENTVLTSPISGVVTMRNYQAGDLPSGPILVIEQQNPLKVVVSVNESEMPFIKQGMAVVVTFDTFTGETFNGRVHLIEPTVDPNTRTFKVEVTIENRGNKLKTGMFARVKFNYGHNTCIVVPDIAVQKQQGSGLRYVYVLQDNGTVKFQEVELGLRDGDKYEVKSGIADGQRVVTKGQARLQDGVKVQIQGK